MTKASDISLAVPPSGGPAGPADRSEQNVRAAAKMYEMRATARSIFGQSYSEKVDPYKRVVAQIAERLQCGPIQAALYMANPASGHGVTLNEFETLLLVSAATELCEMPDQGQAHRPGWRGRKQLMSIFG